MASTNPTSHEEEDEGTASDQICGICFTKMDPLDNPRGVINSCDHKFCAFCIASWAQSSNHCPHCKQRFTRIHTTVLRESPPEDGSSPVEKIVDGRKYYETVEEKKVRRRNYRYEESDDESEEEDDNEEEVRRLLEETAAGNGGNSRGAQFAVDEAEFEAEEADWFERLLAGATGPDDEASPLHDSMSGACSAAPLPTNSPAAPAAAPVAPPSSSTTAHPQATSAVAPQSRNNPQQSQQGGRRNRRAAAAAVVLCSVCNLPIGTQPSVACDKRRCTFIAHLACVGLGDDHEAAAGEDGVSIPLAHGNMVGEKYYCPDHPHQPAAPRRARAPRERRRPQRDDEDENQEQEAQEPPRAPPAAPPVEPLEFGGGAGFVKLPDLPLGTLGTGEAMMNSLPTLGANNNLDTFNSQRLHGMQELAKRQEFLNMNKKNSSTTITTRPMSRGGGGGAFAGRGSGRGRSSGAPTPTIGAAVLTVDKSSLTNRYAGSSSSSHLGGGGRVDPPVAAAGSRDVGKKSQRSQQEKKPLVLASSTSTNGGGPVPDPPSSPKLTSLEAIEAQVYADELENLRDLQYNARKAQGLEMGFRQDMWDSMGQMKVIPSETPKETAAFLAKNREEEERLDDRLKQRARTAAKAYVERVAQARKDHEAVKEARRLAREQTALLKLQMLIATRRREYAERQQKRRALAAAQAPTTPAATAGKK